MSALMDSPENSISNTADAYVAFVQKQMNLLSNELMDGQEIEVLVPLANGNQVVASWFGYQNPDIIKINGQDSGGCDVCLLIHKSKLQVLLRKVSLSQSQKSAVDFQPPGDLAAGLDSGIAMDFESAEEPPFDETA